jgi:hypothetical protein
LYVKCFESNKQPAGVVFVLILEGGKQESTVKEEKIMFLRIREVMCGKRSKASHSFVLCSSGKKRSKSEQ